MLTTSVCETAVATEVLFTGASRLVSMAFIARHPKMSAASRVTARNAALRAATNLLLLRMLPVDLIFRTISVQSQPILGPNQAHLALVVTESRVIDTLTLVHDGRADPTI